MALTDNIASYWKLDESSGNATDATGNGHTLTNNNLMPYGAGKINNGAQPSTTGSKNLSRSDGGGLAVNGNMTISAWFNLTSFASESAPIIISIYPTNTAPFIEWRISLTSTLVQFDRAKDFVANDFLNYTFSVVTGTWYHVVYTWDGTTRTGYFNGAQVVQDTPVGSGTGGDPAGMSIGSFVTNAAQFFNGTIDEVGLWTRALSGAEVTSLYNSGAGLQYPFTGASTLAAKRLLLGVGI